MFFVRWRDENLGVMINVRCIARRERSEAVCCAYYVLCMCAYYENEFSKNVLISAWSCGSVGHAKRRRHLANRRFVGFGNRF